MRALLSEELRSSLPDDCLLSRFVSSITSGYVCFDAETMELESFHQENLVLEAGPVPGLDV